MALKLYDGRISWNGRKVRLLAAELGLHLERVTLDFQKGDYRSAEYLAKNPNGKIPTLEDDGFVVWESQAILIHLAQKQPERRLYPADPREQSRIHQWLFWWTAHVESAFDVLLRERRNKAFLGQQGNDPKLIAEADAALARFLPILDAQLADREHVLGALTIVDFAMAPHLETAPSLQVDLSPYSRIGAWLSRLQAKPYWKDA
jgi:glutathione S-transferase